MAENEAGFELAYLIKLKFTRIQRGITPDEAGKIIGKSKNTYIKKESGEIDFKFQELLDISRRLNISLNSLVRNEY